MTAPALTLITTTCDQPTGFALCERFMRAQTVWGTVPLSWIVVDDGEAPIVPTLGQEYVRREREPECKPAESFCRNLLAAIARVQTPYVAVIEHDDWYAPSHLETLLELLERPGTTIAGDGLQRYYNVAQRRWRTFENFGACLCQTAMHARLLPLFRELLSQHLHVAHYGVDGRLWKRVPVRQWAVANVGTALGIKGLPGRAGLGLGHRPTADWREDADLSTLTTWIGGEAAAIYAPFYAPTELPTTTRRPR